MKTLIAYYSLTGNNKLAAEQLKTKLGSDLDEITDLADRGSMFRNALAAFFKKKTQIRFNKNPQEYDLIVVVSPIWAGNLPPATRTYLNDNLIRQVAFFSVSGSGAKNTKIHKEFERAVRTKPVTTMLVKQNQEVDFDRFVNLL